MDTLARWQFLAQVAVAKATAGSDAAETMWIKNPEQEKLAFDHRKIIADALKLSRK